MLPLSNFSFIFPCCVQVYKLFSSIYTISVAYTDGPVMFDVVALCLYVDQLLTDFTWPGYTILL